MKPAELRGMPEEQLQLTLKETTQNLFHLRVQSATERLETPSQIRKARRDIARIKTVVRERELAAAKAATLAAPAPVAAPAPAPVKPAAPKAAVKKPVAAKKARKEK